VDVDGPDALAIDRDRQLTGTVLRGCDIQYPATAEENPGSPCILEKASSCCHAVILALV
jgi:hypothetical protein